MIFKTNYYYLFILFWCFSCNKNYPEQNRHYIEYLNKPLISLTKILEKDIQDTLSIFDGMYPRRLCFVLKDKTILDVYVRNPRIDWSIWDSLDIEQKNIVAERTKIFLIKERSQNEQITTYKLDSLDYEHGRGWKPFIGQKVEIVLTELTYNFGRYAIESYSKYDPHSGFYYGFTFGQNLTIKISAQPSFINEEVDDKKRFQIFMQSNVESIIISGSPFNYYHY